MGFFVAPPTIVTVKASAEVNSNQSTAETYIVPNGKKAIITAACGTANFNSDAAIKFIWDYGGAGEELIWAVVGDGSIPFTHEVTGDGVKKLAIELENGPGGARYLSGYMVIEVEA